VNDSLNKILVLGASGFVGKNIVEALTPIFNVITTTRNRDKLTNTIFWFDLEDETSWESVKSSSPSFIINCIGYGVIKTEKEVDSIFKINYIKTVAFFEYLSTELPHCKLIHIGSAFEYDLTSVALNESSPTLPLTHYGISKFMASQYLLTKKLNNSFIILRPFNMFGPYEDSSKIIPHLILAQKNKAVVDLSSGIQKRDFCYIGDFTSLLKKILINKSFCELPSCINVGTGTTQTIKSLALLLSTFLPTFDTRFWNWDVIPQRMNEYEEFYNASSLSKYAGFSPSKIETSLLSTIKYYWNL